MILLDTIAYNTFLELVRGQEKRKNNKLKKEEFKNFILNYRGDKYIHSATLFEIYIKSLKSNNDLNFSMFVRDFNALKKFNIKVLNENTWHFDWKSLVEACEKNESYDMTVYVNNKIEYEVTSISRYFMYIFLIVSERLFDKYGDTIGVNLFHATMEFVKELLDVQLKRYLLDYYTTSQKKEVSVKKFDYLLGYILSKIEHIIKNRLTYINRFENPIKFLYEQFRDVEHFNIINLISGVKKSREILSDLNAKEIKRLISTKIDEFEKLVVDEGRRYLTSSEKIYYQSLLLPKSLQQGYKVTKNDFTDCCILSAFDCLDGGSDGIVITLDDTLRKLMKNHDLYYNEDIYNQIFVS
ncbi:hypothetical protein COC45_25805 [Bacillus cereus]|nr:hypothetical protein COC45_25805 [Bacillus cereus]